MNVKMLDIKIENRIRKDFGNIDDLAASISEHGLLQPIVLTPDFVLISGERRLRAAQSLGWIEIPAIIKTAIDREEQLLCEIAENEKRKDFTPSERVAYGLELEQIERIKAKERQGERNDLTSVSTETEVGKPSLRTDEIVGEKIGLSRASYHRAKSVIESGNQEIIKKMDTGEIGIRTAYNAIKSKSEPESPTVIEKIKTGERLGGAAVNTEPEHDKPTAEPESEPEPYKPPVYDKKTFNAMLRQGIREMKDMTRVITLSPEDVLCHYEEFANDIIRRIEMYKEDLYVRAYQTLSEEQHEKLIALNTAMSRAIGKINKIQKGN